MSERIQRAALLLDSSRPDLAAGELRRELAEQPESASAHAMLALCLARQRRGAEAVAAARAAVGLAPDWAHAHYVLAYALTGAGSPAAAERAAAEALRLDPADPWHHVELARARYATGDWRAALEAADGGLALEPDHGELARLRAGALIALGRLEEAERTLRRELARDPLTAATHMTLGEALRQAGRHDEALAAFEAALRLDPGSAGARRGLVEATKAGSAVYALALRLVFWMERRSVPARGAMLAAWVVVVVATTAIHEIDPGLAPLAIPLWALLVAFIALLVLAPRLVDLRLRMSARGRRLFTADQRRAARMKAGLGTVALALFATGVATRTFAVAFAAPTVALLIPVVTTVLAGRRGPLRSRLAVGAALAGGLTACGLAIGAAGLETPGVDLLVLSMLASAVVALVGRRLIRRAGGAGRAGW